MLIYILLLLPVHLILDFQLNLTSWSFQYLSNLFLNTVKLHYYVLLLLGARIALCLFVRPSVRPVRTCNLKDWKSQHVHILVVTQHVTMCVKTSFISIAWVKKQDKTLGNFFAKYITSVWYLSIQESRSMESITVTCFCHNSCCLPYVTSRLWRAYISATVLTGHTSFQRLIFYKVV